MYDVPSKCSLFSFALLMRLSFFHLAIDLDFFCGDHLGHSHSLRNGSTVQLVLTQEIHAAQSHHGGWKDKLQRSVGYR